MAQEVGVKRTISFENELERKEGVESVRKPLSEEEQTQRDEDFSREYGAFLVRSSESKTNAENQGTIVFNTQRTEIKAENILGELFGAVASQQTLKSVKEANVLVKKSIVELLKDYVFFRVKKADLENKSPEDLKKVSNKKSFYENLKRFAGFGMERKLKVSQQAENINAKLGGNLSYEGVIRESMEVRIDVEALLDKKNSEMNERELQAKRARVIAMASGGKGKKGRVAVKQELNPEKGINAGARNAYTQAG